MDPNQYSLNGTGLNVCAIAVCRGSQREEVCAPLLMRANKQTSATGWSTSTVGETRPGERVLGAIVGLPTEVNIEKLLIVVYSFTAA